MVAVGIPFNKEMQNILFSFFFFLCVGIDHSPFGKHLKTSCALAHSIHVVRISAGPLLQTEFKRKGLSTIVDHRFNPPAEPTASLHHIKHERRRSHARTASLAKATLTCLLITRASMMRFSPQWS